MVESAFAYHSALIVVAYVASTIFLLGNLLELLAPHLLRGILSPRVQRVVTSKVAYRILVGAGCVAYAACAFAVVIGEGVYFYPLLVPPVIHACELVLCLYDSYSKYGLHNQQCILVPNQIIQQLLASHSVRVLTNVVNDNGVDRGVYALVDGGPQTLLSPPKQLLAVREVGSYRFQDAIERV
jgi:hypothetical protein